MNIQFFVNILLQITLVTLCRVVYIYNDYLNKTLNIR